MISIRPKRITFPLMVPSFLSSKGIYHWNEIYETRRNGKLEAFLTVLKEFIVDIV